MGHKHNSTLDENFLFKAIFYSISVYELKCEGKNTIAFVKNAEKSEQFVVLGLIYVLHYLWIQP